MFIVGTIFAILCMILFFAANSKYIKALALVLLVSVIALLIIFNQRSNEVKTKPSSAYSSGTYDYNYEDSKNTSPKAVVESSYYDGKNLSQQDNNEDSQPDDNSNNQNDTNNQGNSNTKKNGLKSKYLQELAYIREQVDEISENMSGITIEMKRDCSKIYELWDDELNVIYKAIRKTMTESEKQALKQEEIEWLKYRDKKADEDAYEFRGGTMESLERIASKGTTTEDRCYELVNKYMD